MSKYSTAAVIAAFVLLAGALAYAQQNNKVSLTQITDELNNMQVRVNRSAEGELPELTTEQRQALEEAREKVLEARRQLIETELEIGLITKDEAQFFHDHLDLMARYGQDYDPPAWCWSHSSIRNRGIMGHGHR